MKLNPQYKYFLLFLAVFSLIYLIVISYFFNTSNLLVNWDSDDVFSLFYAALIAAPGILVLLYLLSSFLGLAKPRLADYKQKDIAYWFLNSLILAFSLDFLSAAWLIGKAIFHDSGFDIFKLLYAAMLILFNAAGSGFILLLLTLFLLPLMFLLVLFCYYSLPEKLVKYLPAVSLLLYYLFFILVYFINILIQ